MSNRPCPPAMRAEAVRLVRTGMSARLAAQQVSKQWDRIISKSAVEKWAKLDAEPPKPKRAPVAPKPEAPVPPPADAHAQGADLIAHNRQMLAEARELARLAKAEGNHAAAQKYTRDAAGMLNTLARLEKESKAIKGGITLSAEDIARAEAELDDVEAKLAADLERTGGLVCSSCGRAIRLAIAKGDSDV